MSVDVMKRLVFITFRHQAGRYGTLDLQRLTVDFDDGDSFTLQYLLDNPDVTSIQFTSH